MSATSGDPWRLPRLHLPGAEGSLLASVHGCRGRAGWWWPLLRATSSREETTDEDIPVPVDGRLSLCPGSGWMAKPPIHMLATAGEVSDRGGRTGIAAESRLRWGGGRIRATWMRVFFKC